MSGTESEVVEGNGEKAGAEGTLQALQALMGLESAATAARLYEELSAAQRERLLRDAALAPARERQQLSEVLSWARDFAGAARLLQGCGADSRMASLYVQGGQYVDAAEAFLRAGDAERAAAAFERGGALERALEVYRGLGSREQVAHCLVRLGRPHEGALLYRELGQPHAEVEALGCVPAGDARHTESVLRMCMLLDAEGFTRRALALLADTLRGSETARGDPALAAEKARLLRRMGMDAEAEAVIARLPAQSSSPEANGYNYLKAIPIFGELSLVDMKDLYRVARQVLIPAGAVMLEKGAAGVGLFVLLEGTVDVYTGTEDDARRLNTLGPGAYLGEISLVQDAPVSARVKARTSVRALRITRAGFQHYLDTHEGAALRIFRLFTQNLAARVRALST
ncbi:cyclic nucleotide-binding domain-containing protein [Myxococcus sp. K38C18041901]|uniref:cyclic nucleotide-binding domain-containing protein n=1 Tax=Myxococcus guangdongensis TaxID=2906760 RepID=UPI0020A82E39|nr:cyclic nucleotide-binding domain-containing protein [Myxococcus guangdongensis]MCP3064369.1 cyclic nucleotide-binding domain-containing protein [Myxococcus guangdongensis]